MLENLQACLKKTFGPILNLHHYLQQHSCSNCSTISNIDCCPQQCHTTTNTNNRNHKPSKCQLFDDIGMTIKEYHNGQKWLEQCQECECLVSERNIHTNILFHVSKESFYVL